MSFEVRGLLMQQLLKIICKNIHSQMFVLITCYILCYLMADVKYVDSSRCFWTLTGFFHLTSKWTHQHINSQDREIINIFFFFERGSCSLAFYKKISKLLSSPRLTILILIYAVVLIFIGTIAQKEIGISSAQSQYF